MRVTLLLAAASALLFMAMVIYTWPLDPSIPAIQFTFTEAAFNNTLNGWQPAEFARFKYHFAIDFPFLLCYGALGYFITMRTPLFRIFKAHTKTLIAALLPVAAGADAIENALHLFFVSATGPLPPTLYMAAGLAASTKWGLIVAFFACSTYALRKNASQGAIR
jgi:hypothetical protein